MIFLALQLLDISRELPLQEAKTTADVLSQFLWQSPKLLACFFR
jgi:hypothetical protein